MCAVCGESFAAELMMHKAVDAISISVVEGKLPVHDKCGELVLKISAEDSDWRKLPQGPLRTAFEEAEAGTVDCLKCGKPIQYQQGTCPHCGYKEF